MRIAHQPGRVLVAGRDHRGHALGIVGNAAGGLEAGRRHRLRQRLRRAAKTENRGHGHRQGGARQSDRHDLPSPG